MQFIRQFLCLSTLALAGVVCASEFDQNTFYQLCQEAYKLTEAKHNMYSSDLANQDTPGYKQHKLDTSFESAWKRAVADGDVAALQGMDVLIVNDVHGGVLQMDGNNVDANAIMFEMSNNYVENQMLQKVLAGHFTNMNLALD